MLKDTQFVISRDNIMHKYCIICMASHMYRNYMCDYHSWMKTLSPKYFSHKIDARYYFSFQQYHWPYRQV